MIPDPKTLIDDLKASVNDPAKKLILANLAADVTRVAAQALTDPAGAEQELLYVRAATANLTAAEASTVESKVLEWLAALVRSALLGALSA